MIKDNDKIIILKCQDYEIYKLVEKIKFVNFGIITFDGNPVKEIRVKSGKPYQIITIEKSNLLSENENA